MKSLAVSLVLLEAFVCWGGDFTTLQESVKLASDAKGLLITTNDTAIPFYVLGDDPNLASMVGHRLDTGIVSSTRMELISQLVPRLKLQQGRLSPAASHKLISGRYAMLEGRTLSLSDFTITVSTDTESRDEVLAVTLESCSFQVGADFALAIAKARKLTSRQK